MERRDPEYFIKLSKSSSFNKRLESVAQNIEKRGFDFLEPGEYMFLIKMYMGKIIDMHSGDKEVVTNKLYNILENMGLDIHDYTNNNYNKVITISKEAAKRLINIYKMRQI